jgi:beta-lactamase superfamily II metal-dependent hydrolase
MNVPRAGKVNSSARPSHSPRRSVARKIRRAPDNTGARVISSVQDSLQTSSSARSKQVPGICVRMYNVGFGDAFLITYPGLEHEHRILIDCGSIASGGHPMHAIVGDLMRRCADPSAGARIDVVIATHRHKDHISGFANDAWKTVSVGEVWMPWTENPEDSEASSIRERQQRVALALSQTLEVSPATSPLNAYREAILNATGNEQSMERLLRGFAGVRRRRYLPESRDLGEVVESEHLPGVRAHVLGPSRSEALIRDVDPPAGKSYLGMAEHRRSDQAAESLFTARWQLNKRQFEKSYSHLRVSANVTNAIQDVASSSDPLLAASLDRAINGTSLVLVLEIDGKYLLFPGDAQWGTWSQILSTDVATRLLAKTSLFKLGHHASHNGTPIEFVEKYLPERTPSLVSTRSMINWPEIPRVPLLEALDAKHCPLARSDQSEKVPEAVFHAQESLFIEVQI